MGFELTGELLAHIARLPSKQRQPVLAAVAKLEWEKCAADIFYWLDATQHYKSAKYPQGQPYAFTNDPHPMHQCVLCSGEDATLTYHFNKRRGHLQMKHDLYIPTEKELSQYFTQLPGTRPFTLQPYMPPIIEAWMAEPLMVVEKSRDMMATWLVVTLYSWDTLFHSNRQNIFQSEDSSKTDEPSTTCRLSLPASTQVPSRGSPRPIREGHWQVWSTHSREPLK
jgi:hypothetical protein